MTLFKQTKPFAWLSSISAAVMLTSLSMSAQAEVLDYIVATVNSEVVLNSELEAAVADRRSRLMAEGQPVPDSETLVKMREEIKVMQAQLNEFQTASKKDDAIAKDLELQLDDEALGKRIAELEKEVAVYPW